MAAFEYAVCLSTFFFIVFTGIEFGESHCCATLLLYLCD